MGKKFFSAAVICISLLMLCSCNGGDNKTASNSSKVSDASLTVPESSVVPESSSAPESSVVPESSSAPESSEIFERSDISDIDEEPDSSIEESYEPFTEKELDDMSEVNDRISEFVERDEFKQADIKTRVGMAAEFLNTLADEGLVKKGSISASTDTVSYRYSSGVMGAVMCREFDPMYN